MFNQITIIPIGFFCALLCICISCQQANSKNGSPRASENFDRQKTERTLARPTLVDAHSSAAVPAKKTELPVIKKVNKPTKTQARELFDKYVRLGNNFDPSVVDLYSKNSKTMVYEKGTRRLIMELDNGKFVKMIKAMMPAAKLEDDRNLFKQIKIAKHGEGFEVKAHRYSTMKCYTDKKYAMQMQPNEFGELEIVREVMGYQRRSQCP